MTCHVHLPQGLSRASAACSIVIHPHTRYRTYLVLLFNTTALIKGCSSYGRNRGIKCLQPSKTISLITWLGPYSTRYARGSREGLREGLRSSSQGPCEKVFFIKDGELGGLRQKN
ncbi:unnamed protein product [Ascophyllum nodosum]